MGKTPFLSPFLHFFKKIELFRGKTVRINIFPGGIKKSVNIGKKKQRFLMQGGGKCPSPEFLTEISLEYFYDEQGIVFYFSRIFQVVKKTIFIS